MIPKVKAARMKAIVYEQYGVPGVLQIKEIEKPTPKHNEVLIQIQATTVTSGDCRVRSLNVPAGFGLMMRLIFGFSKPKQPVLGTELAGVVVEVGREVSKFKVGDHVFGFSDMKMGCYAEYKCMAEDAALVLKPANVSVDEAAAISFGGTTALDFLRRAKLQRGEKILINGASGGVGTAAMQLAKHFGAEVTAVCSSANVELVIAMGANHVIDYTKQDFTKNGKRYDVIVDAVGTAPFSRSKVSLNEGGRLLMVIADLADMLSASLVSMFGNKKNIAGPVSVRAEDLQFLAALAAVREFKPLIDRRYPFEQIADAHRYVDTGRKRGNVVINVV
jgi:NADPH:quinone reductase-like Zn-dependent oxidoreductase